ncbi:MAG: hypothetical protein ACMV1B_01220 [Prevotella sp.]
MSSPMDDIPTTGGMNTSSSNTGSTSKKRESTTLGYVNISIGGMRVGSVQVESNPYGFSSNPIHKSLVELFSYDLTPDELKAEVSELIETLGIEFNCQLAGSEKQVTPAVDYSSKFSNRTKRTIK